MGPLIEDIRKNRLLWLLALVLVVLAFHLFKPEAHTLLFILSVLGSRNDSGTSGSRRCGWRRS